MKPITTIVMDWAYRAFGVDHVTNTRVRALRLAEEAIELVQSYDLPKEQIMALVEMVYSRPPGEPFQELGGVMITATVLAASQGTELDDALLAELRRVLAKSPEHFAARNQEKVDAGMTA